MSYSVSGKARVIKMFDASVVKSTRFTQLVEMLRRSTVEEDLRLDFECVKPMPKLDRDLISMFDTFNSIVDHHGCDQLFSSQEAGRQLSIL